MMNEMSFWDEIYLTAGTVYASSYHIEHITQAELSIILIFLFDMVTFLYKKMVVYNYSDPSL